MLRTFWLSIALILTAGTALAAKQEQLFFASKKYDSVVIERVLTADKVILDTGEKVRLIGLTAPDAPRRAKQERDEKGFVIEKDEPVVPLEDQAFEFAREMMEGKTVRLELDAQKQDENFRTLAYVFLKDGTLVNAEILRQGYAHLHIQPPNMKYAEDLRKAYREAKTEKRGLQNE